MPGAISRIELNDATVKSHRIESMENSVHREVKPAPLRLTRVLPRGASGERGGIRTPHAPTAQNAEPMLNDCRAVDRLQYYCPNKRRPTCITRGIFPHALVPLMKE